MRLAPLFCLLLALVNISAAQDTNFPVGPQYLLTGSPLLARSIATPTMSLDIPLPPLPELPEVGPKVQDQPFIPNPITQLGPDLLPIYYGYPMPPVVIVVSEESPREVPASLVDSGVVDLINGQSGGQQGYGINLGAVAMFWKTHKTHAPRVYTNADVERLHGS